MTRQRSFHTESPPKTDFADPDVDVREAEILLLEDEPEMRDLLTMVLSENGYEVAAVSSAIDGIEAIEKIGERGGDLYGLDLVVLDWWLPGMSGDQFLNWLRDRDDYTPVLVVSGFLDEDVLDEAGRSGATMALAKPFSIGKFLRAIEALTE